MAHKSGKPAYGPKPGHPGRGMPARPNTGGGRKVGRNPSPGTPRKVGRK